MSDVEEQNSVEEQDNVVSINGLAITGRPNQALISMLERSLAEAKLGVVCGGAVAFITVDDAVRAGYAYTHGKGNHLTGAIAYLKHKFMHETFMTDD